MKISLSISIVIFLLTSCSTKISRPECINDDLDDLLIRWGKIILEDRYIEGFEIDSKANLYEIKVKNQDYILKNKKGKIDFTIYCDMLAKIRKEFIEVQALHSPGDTSHFVEYIHNSLNTNLRALWNPKFQTVLSKGFREIYDSLSVQVNYVK